MSSSNLSRSSSLSRRNQRPMSIGAIRRAAMSLIEPRPAQQNDDMVERVVESKKKILKIGGHAEKLPQKYELLDTFFNSLDSSIRLLQLTRKPTTFTNIADQVKILTERRFLQSHLAQLKYILPEAIVIKRILRREEHTHCMVPDLCIQLDLEAIQDIRSKKKSCKHSKLREVFHERLLDFVKSHPEGDEVPEKALPELFNHSKHIPDESSAGPFNGSATNFRSSLQTPSSASHFPHSFKRSFSLLHPRSSCQPITSTNESVCNISTPLKPLTCIEDDQSSAMLLKTPVELASTPAKLISVLNTPKRCDKKRNDDDEPLTSPRKLLRRRPPANRPLMFNTPVRRKTASSSDGDIYEVLDEDLVQSIQEKERIALMEQDPAFSHARNRQKMISTLPKMFDMIRFFFQSIKRTVLPKEELLEEMMTGNSVIRDGSEVVDQLKLLQEIVPEWIYEKPASSGEVLVCVNKDSSLTEVIRKRIAEASD